MFVLQEAVSDVQVIDDVVEIIVGNEIITDLTDPIRIGFHHDPIPVSCVCSLYICTESCNLSINCNL